MKYQQRLLGFFLALYFGFAYAGEQLDSIAVAEKTFAQYEVFDAVVEAVNHSTVSSRISAQVIEVNFDVNDVVPKDAVLMRFKDDEFRARVAQVEASILADKAQARGASARQKEANSEAKRVRSLFERRLVAQAALDKANANLSAASARLQTVRAQSKSRQAQLDEARLQLSYTKIVAPYGGIVTERMIEVGEMVSPGQNLMTGVSMKQRRVLVNIPQYLLRDIQSSENYEFILDDWKVKGSALTVVPNANVQNHSFVVRVDLPETTQDIYPGMFGKLRFAVGEESIRVVPKSAVVQRSEVAGVYVLDDEQRIIFRQIRLGRLMHGEYQEVLAGLGVGENVITQPLKAARQLKLNSFRSSL